MLRRSFARVLFAVAVAGASAAVYVTMGSAAEQANPPSNSSPPTITGDALVGATLTAQSGSWTGANPITFTYQWERCDSTGGSCTSISSATSQTYTLQSADGNHRIRVAVTATNADGTGGPVLSSPTGIVASATAPVNTSAPQLTGTLKQGSTLTVTSGSWTGTAPITYSYEWQRCNGQGSNCTPFKSGSDTTYTLSSADVGNRMQVYVTASNSAGSARKYSNQTGVIGVNVAAPVNTAAPQLTGTLKEGQTLHVTSGSWNGSGLSFTYQWQRCNAQGVNCGPLAGVSGQSYKLTSADVGNRLQVYVTATNAGGSASKYSNQTDVIGANVAAPVNTAAPQLTGTAEEGQTLQVTSGSWNGSGVSYAYQWQRCNAQGVNCASIAGVSGQAYTLTSADVGNRVQVYVTATNAGGSASRYSNQTGVVAAASGAVSASTVNLPDRLVVDRIKYPNGGHSRKPFTVRFHVGDTQNHSVSGALVYVVGLPYGWIRPPAEQATDGSGWVTLTIVPTVKMPRSTLLVMFVRARTPQGDVLAGASTRRLVQVRVHP